jgi:hypothetical protein
MNFFKDVTSVSLFDASRSIPSGLAKSFDSMIGSFKGPSTVSLFKASSSIRLGLAKSAGPVTGLSVMESYRSQKEGRFQ